MTILKKADLLLEGLSREVSLAEVKATITVFIVPLFLMVVLKDVISVLLWFGFCITLYSKVKKGTENGRVFFLFLKNSIIIYLTIFVTIAFLILF